MQQAPLHPREPRFHELDILRGLAAVTVVVFHYKHFLLISDAAGFDYNDMPLHAVLMPLYVYGQFFVELFFAISGYVFFWLYADAVTSHRTGPWSFFVARFARLYPLYIVTLLAAAALQAAYHSQAGADFIYRGDSPVAFVLNLLMVQQWVPWAQQSFNGPAWSISVEVFLYAVFFALCYFGLNRPWVLTLLFAAGVVVRVMSDPTVDFVRGVPSFFEGGLVFYAVQALRRHDAWRRRIVVVLAIALPALWALSYMRGFQPINTLLAPGVVNAVFSVVTFLYVLVPLTLLALGLMQDHWTVAWLSRASLHRVSWIGDISYSIYLIHFPLQLVVMLALMHLPFSRRAHIFASPFSLLAFMIVAAGLAWLSFHLFEMPLRRYLGKRMRPLVSREATE